MRDRIGARAPPTTSVSTIVKSAMELAVINADRGRMVGITAASAGANSTAGTVYVNRVIATGVLPPEILNARMISENRRNLSASWAASCANQMFRNAVYFRTVRKPPGALTGNRIGSSTAVRA